MKLNYSLLAALIVIAIPTGRAAAQSVPGGHEGIYAVIAEVEANNHELEARRRLRDALSIETRMENNIDDPEVEYVHQWGRPSAAGPASELTVTQSFDFPTVYARRAKLADKRAEIYGYEYEIFRQQLLFEAHTLCIRISALESRLRFLRSAMEDAERVADLANTKARAGSATALEASKARFEYITAANAYKMTEVELCEAVARLATLNGGQIVGMDNYPLEEPGIIRPYDEMAAIYESLSPDMLMAISELDAAHLDIKVSRSRSLPKLAVGYKRDTGPGEKLNGVVAGMTIPLFSNKNNVKRARAQAGYAEAEVRRVRNDMMSYLLSLYTRAQLLEASAEQYRLILDYSDSVGLLRRALDEGHISIIDYYAQLQPVYDGVLTMLDVMEEYHLVCAQINAVFL